MITREEYNKALDIVEAYHFTASKIVEAYHKQLFIGGVSKRFYQIDFGNHLRCKLKITDGEIGIEGAMKVVGNDGVPVPLSEIVILELNDC